MIEMYLLLVVLQVPPSVMTDIDEQRILPTISIRNPLHSSFISMNYNRGSRADVV
jgi:hypothetical protein